MLEINFSTVMQGHIFIAQLRNASDLIHSATDGYDNGILFPCRSKLWLLCQYNGGKYISKYIVNEPKLHLEQSSQLGRKVAFLPHTPPPYTHKPRGSYHPQCHLPQIRYPQLQSGWSCHECICGLKLSVHGTLDIMCPGVA